MPQSHCQKGSENVKQSINKDGNNNNNNSHDGACKSSTKNSEVITKTYS